MRARFGLFFLILPFLAACAPERVNPDTGEWLQTTQQHINASAHIPFDPQNPDKQHTGIVIVRINVHESGRIYTPLVARSSGDSMLDNAALLTVLAANPLSPPPIARGKRYAEVLLPVIYSPNPEATPAMEAEAWEILRAMQRDRDGKNNK